ncbi:hypothetical protein FHX48_001620 [Microbacterium halimionae]|uniref:DUF2975 domain-containing protein n=1 Tax=Microbacterium halimionae TaxID=1526413 RepID=A0A7W3JPD5_9MICO|nr:DUF2975 domain-containing protein [Microbacterium halimionae]MBA8816547.1 hypothetical protein [Microbacterium halimionae]NII95266.1 hypothetical protein [Microbacterium halimionae]
MHRTTVLCLKTLITILLGLLVTCQIFVVPAVAAQSAVRYSDIAYFEIPGTIVGIAFLICVEVVLICVWRLLSLVREDAIFSETAFPDVDVSLGAVVTATALVVVALVALSLTGFMTASITLLLLLGIAVGAGLSLLIVVLRGLLRKASQLEHDLSEVV